jgi:hypothetical protein
MMNERILEFARQSGGIDMTNHTAGGITTWVGTGTPEFLERFAELIVRECCDWIDGSPATDAGQLLLTKSFITANLKGHFGVAE